MKRGSKLRGVMTFTFANQQISAVIQVKDRTRPEAPVPTISTGARFDISSRF
jgi:hypothetical protein